MNIAKMYKKIARKSFLNRTKNNKNLMPLVLFGIVGWHIVIPSLLGIFLGRYLDQSKVQNSQISWTLTLFFVGLSIGLFNVWRLLNRANKTIDLDNKNSDKDK